MKTLKLTINPLDRKSKIRKEIYSNFSEHLGRCVYDGIYVGNDSDVPNIEGYREDVIEAFRQIKLPVLRWPGGCFADEYHWMDGIGELSSRKKMINTNWGGLVEDNSFGTHEFMRLCELVGCEPYISANVGSGTVEELAKWIEYITFDGVSPMADLRRKNGREEPWKLKYLGIGNESWGGGGNMTPEFYCDNYRRYSLYAREYSGNKLFRIACGPNAEDYNWTDVCMQRLGTWAMQGLSLHYYTVPTGNWEHKGSAVEFSESEYYDTIKKTLYMDELLTRHSGIMDRYDPEHKVGLIVDEWGTWYDVEPGTNPGFLYQQNTMRDALVAGVTLNIFNKHCDRVKMACIAQMVNVLQSVILTEGPKMVLTPTYHVFHMYKYHQDAELLESYIEGNKTVGVSKDSQVPHLDESVSVDQDGYVNVTLANLSANEDAPVEMSFIELAPKEITAVILKGEMHAHNTFEEPENVKEEAFGAYEVKDGKVSFTAPAGSVISFRMK